MPETEQNYAGLGRKRIAIALLLAGVVAIFSSLVWPALAMRRVLWSDEQARQYQQASAKLHALAHEMGDKASGKKGQGVPPELQQAQADYDQIRHQLDVARQEPARMSSAIFWGGILLSAVGAALYFATHQ
jgi:hypothetical protein